jgi:nitrogenase molybdenum-iron protein alpha chain
MENDEFVKNLEKHAINPYTDWWLAQDPFSFLGDNVSVRAY